MTGFAAVLAVGFFLGMRHATDPDHVIAVSTIVARQKSPRSAAWIGALWGVGHTLTILAVGGGIILFRWVIPVRVGLSMEFSVGLMLIVLGIMNLSGVMQRITESGMPIQNPAHSHSHAAEPPPVAWLDRQLGTLGMYQFVRPLIVGVVHGLAGSAAVALLVLATINDRTWSIFYLLIFGVGTVLGMMLITAVIALPFAYAGARSIRLNAALRVATGVLSLVFGLFLAYQVGVVQGLFSGRPQWIPR